MAYRIDYFRDGVKVGQVPFPGSLDDARRSTFGGMIKLDADTAKILDTEKNHQQVDVMKR
jgi:hypothetical protein